MTHDQRRRVHQGALVPLSLGFRANFGNLSAECIYRNRRICTVPSMEAGLDETGACAPCQGLSEQKWNPKNKTRISTAEGPRDIEEEEGGSRPYSLLYN
ncbi:hypothetical protein PROFUN_11214 [Planoprotostelium fungivorum]|uniref:Uncharacterized protein n=1 Tax=Planoprotostelium fungivorum TaxID=1890364 RepID=A0A2P6NAW9_9EUKA|nr:hypothetical protein PROFUN_11214 [Planoprotostelium fungivorum]